MSKTAVSHPEKKASTGTYSAAILCDGWLYISGHASQDLQVIALIAAAIEPNTFFDEANQDGMMNFSYLYDKPVPLRAAPELFCMDLYRHFDIDLLSRLASPTQLQPQQ